jgi:hypothetical protein
MDRQRKYTVLFLVLSVLVSGGNIYHAFTKGQSRLVFLIAARLLFTCITLGFLGMRKSVIMKDPPLGITLMSVFMINFLADSSLFIS